MTDMKDIMAGMVEGEPPFGIIIEEMLSQNRQAEGVSGQDGSWPGRPCCSTPCPSGPPSASTLAPRVRL
jgi:hypothetical protein